MSIKTFSPKSKDTVLSNLEIWMNQVKDKIKNTSDPDKKKSLEKELQELKIQKLRYELHLEEEKLKNM